MNTEIQKYIIFDDLEVNDALYNKPIFLEKPPTNAKYPDGLHISSYKKRK